MKQTYDVSAWKSSPSGTCGTFTEISVIVVAVQPRETANHMRTVRLNLVSSALFLVFPSLSEKNRKLFSVLRVTSSSEIPQRGTDSTLSCHMAVRFPALFISCLPSFHSLEVNGRPVIAEKASTLHHFDGLPPSQRVMPLGIQHVLACRRAEDEIVKEVKQRHESQLCVCEATISDRPP